MFFDLSLLRDGQDDGCKRELAAFALGLGYGTFAVEHGVKGPVSSEDSCKLAPLNVESLMAAGPGGSLKQNRALLKKGGGGNDVRQFTRLTVDVDTPAQAASLNAATSILATYDLIAARPLNQRTFHQACSSLEVDLITLDLSNRLPFKLRSPSVKAAMQRGVMFEITYALALREPVARRHLFANAQTLHLLTRGKSIIISSGATSPSDLRGPYDVANMATLFGFDIASAKAALSHNCSSLISRGAARKETYKSAIRLERLLPEPTLLNSTASPQTTHTTNQDNTTTKQDNTTSAPCPPPHQCSLVTPNPASSLAPQSETADAAAQVSLERATAGQDCPVASFAEIEGKFEDKVEDGFEEKRLVEANGGEGVNFVDGGQRERVSPEEEAAVVSREDSWRKRPWEASDRSNGESVEVQEGERGGGAGVGVSGKVVGEDFIRFVMDDGDEAGWSAARSTKKHKGESRGKSQRLLGARGSHQSGRHGFRGRGWSGRGNRGNSKP